MPSFLLSRLVVFISLKRLLSYIKNCSYIHVFLYSVMWLHGSAFPVRFDGLHFPVFEFCFPLFRWSSEACEAAGLRRDVIRPNQPLTDENAVGTSRLQLPRVRRVPHAALADQRALRVTAGQ